MKTNLSPADITPGVISVVNAYLMARAYAETMRSKVDKIKRGILKECPLTNGLEIEHGEEPRTITAPSHVYLCTDPALLAEYDAECDKRLREAGLKPDDMEKGFCPALVAEDIQNKTERLIFRTVTEMMGIEDWKNFQNKALRIRKKQKFIDLVVKLVVSLPDWERHLPSKKGGMK